MQKSVDRVSMGALVREGHPPFIGEGGEKASTTFMQEGERWREIDLHVERWHELSELLIK